MGITVVARTDAQACTNEAAAVHPEWLNIDENGFPRKHRSLPDRYTGVTADQMTTKAIAETQGSLKVDPTAGDKFTQSRAPEAFRGDVGGKAVVAGGDPNSPAPNSAAISALSRASSNAPASKSACANAACAPASYGFVRIRSLSLPSVIQPTKRFARSSGR